MGTRAAHSWWGYERPVTKDWLVLVALLLVVIQTVMFLATGLSMWQTFAGVPPTIVVVGVVGGSIRSFQRGLRDAN